MINSGQTCGALKRLYVHEDDLDATANALAEFAANIPMGDGMAEVVCLVRFKMRGSSNEW